MTQVEVVSFSGSALATLQLLTFAVGLGFFVVVLLLAGLLVATGLRR